MLHRLIDYPGPLWRPWAALVWLLMALAAMIWGPIIMIGAAFGRSRAKQTGLLRSWLRLLTRLLHLRIEVRGRENHDPAQPCLVVSNHQSHLDIPAAFEALGGDIRMVAKVELFRIPIFGPSMRRTEFIPLERGSRADSKRASQAILERIRSGIHVWVAPEGTRSPDGQLGVFKTGSFALAIQAGVPIQPIAILNSREAMPKSSLLVRPGTTIQVRVLPRIPTAGMDVAARRGLAEQVKQSIADAMARA